MATLVTYEPFHLTGTSRQAIKEFTARFRKTHYNRPADEHGVYIFEQEMINEAQYPTLVIMLSEFLGETAATVESRMKYAAAPATATADQWRAYYRNKKTTDQTFIQLLESYTAGSVESNLETMLRRVSVNGGRLTDMVTDYVSGVRTAILRFSLSG